MKTITIGFSKSRKRFAVGSRLIRWYMGTDYSHVYLEFNSSKLDRTLIYEAVGSGVRFIGQQLWTTHAITVKSHKIQVTQESYTKLMQICIDKAGVDYGYSQNIGLVIADLLNMDHNPFNSGKNCSELVAEVLVVEGYKFKKELNLLTPKDIEETLVAGKLIS